MTSNTIATLFETIEARLRSAFAPTFLELKDESHLHAGHSGAVGGGQHFALTLHSAAFADKSLVKRHQLVYTVLHDLMQDTPSAERDRIGYIHALKLQLQIAI